MVHLAWLVSAHSSYFSLSSSFLSLDLGAMDKSHLLFFVDMLEGRTHLLERVQRGKHHFAVFEDTNAIVGMNRLTVDIYFLRLKLMSIYLYN